MDEWNEKSSFFFFNLNVSTSLQGQERKEFISENERYTLHVDIQYSIQIAK